MESTEHVNHNEYMSPVKPYETEIIKLYQKSNAKLSL